MPGGGSHAIGPPKRRVRWASRVRALSTSSSSPTCPNKHLLLSMLSNCICIVVPSSRYWQTKTESRTPIVGVLTRPAERRAWQVVAQWIWNLRLELGHSLKPTPLRTTEFAPALPPPSPHTAPSSGYVPPEVGSTWKAGRFSGHDFTLQPDGTLRCPANQELRLQEQRREIDGSLRVVYGASIRSCRPCEASAHNASGMAALLPSHAR